MSVITSADGTSIGFMHIGSGPVLVLVDGALSSRALGPSAKLAAELADEFTVVTYDRRGRGESGDTAPWALEREVEDLAGVIEAVGGRACVAGVSSGGALALEAAGRLAAIERVAVYEVPFVVAPTGNVMPEGFVERLEAHVAAGERSEAVRMFMRHVGAPAPMVALMRLLPVWRRLTAVAPTLPHDLRILGDRGRGQPLPADAFAGVTVPVLVLDGGKSPEWMRASGRAVADVLPHGRHGTLPGQTHMVKPAVLAPALRGFFRERAAAGDGARPGVATA